MSRLQPSCPRTLPTATPTLPVARTRISSSCPPVQYRCTARAATTGEGDTPGMVIVARVRRNTQQKDQLWPGHCAKRSGAQRGARVFCAPSSSSCAQGNSDSGRGSRLAVSPDLGGSIAWYIVILASLLDGSKSSRQCSLSYTYRSVTL